MSAQRPDPPDETLAAIRAGEAPVEVAGSGPLAVQLLERFPKDDTPAAQSPRTVVDTTGDVDELHCLLERVDDLGTVVLAGPPLPPDSTVDLYSDLHVRGLTLIAVPPAAEEGA